MSIETVVIVGAGHAAPDAISTLRRADWQGKIILIGDEPHLPYQRPPLSKAYFSDEVEQDRLVIRNHAFYQKNEVELKLGQRVESIDRNKSCVVLEGGEQVSYTKLVLATGTRARLLPVTGIESVNAHYLRTIDDVDAIKENLNDNTKLLIVGAGYIGLELAASAVKPISKEQDSGSKEHQRQVTVLESMDRVLARVTGEEVSNFYQDLHRQAGVDIRLNASLAEFQKSDGKQYALMADGEKIEFDVLVVGIGVLPNSELAEQAGIECDNGIVVNEYTQSSDKNIYAIGDVSNHPNAIYQTRLRLESVPNATGQAKVAASHICGKDITHNQLPWFWSDQYDVKLQTAGLFQGYDETQVQGDVEQQKFSVSYFKEGKLIAIDALNSPADFMKAKKRIVEDLSG